MVDLHIVWLDSMVLQGMMHPFASSRCFCGLSTEHISWQVMSKDKSALPALSFCDHITASARYCVITSQPLIPQALVCLSHLHCLKGWQQHSSHMAACQFSGIICIFAQHASTHGTHVARHHCHVKMHGGIVL